MRLYDATVEGFGGVRVSISPRDLSSPSAAYAEIGVSASGIFEPAFSAACARCDSGVLILDIELDDWTPTIQHTRDRIREIVAQWTTLLAAARAAAPWAKIGIYGVAPICHFGTQADYRNSVNWRKVRDVNLWLAPIYERVDFLSPSLYAVSRDPAAWAAFAVDVSRMCHEVARSKPVIPFLWARYHEYTGLGGVPLPVDYWSMQIDWVKHLFGAAVVWGSLPEHARPALTRYVAAN